MENSQKALVLLRQIIRSTDMQDKDISRSTGLTPPQLMVMQTLRENTQLTTGELAKEMVLTQATVTSILDRLERKELIARERGIEDKRKVWVSLTEKGVELMKGAPTTQQDIFVRNFEDMQNWEQSMIVSSLERIAFMLNAQHLDAAPLLDIGELDRSQQEYSKN
ncbi:MULTISPECIES: MarR family winged helix-turn-helix transcriptional regulator [Amphritea]|uniref:DNA-binding transcriptional regulator, MarR family n=2 Tax=Amphritea TaxID=515417 RepID=A0A1H9FZG8_9GAMM|nr:MULTISPECIES: MarR family transcriptional regulator [Amphritea]MBN0988508.1 MarR family transcriptional regulator [Amphritea pacifica]MBN1008381.1 MarR family transcriptional regulator [Amphritea pacifica]SEQ43189.1 DNA-binding transcriptional regulator, MarR family [Amphritea atlantica]